MIELKGKFGKAIVYTNNIDSIAVGQIIDICNQEFSQGKRIAIMPDVHPGRDCTVGTTLEIADKIAPSLIGTDIGCGIVCIKLKEKYIDFEELDKLIRAEVPYGMNIRRNNHRFVKQINLEDIRATKFLEMDRALKSMGTLGGGNHFIEIDKDDENLYLLIHTGSRALGKQIAQYYQGVAIKETMDNRTKGTHVSKGLAYLEKENLNDYLNDLEIAQSYARLNRLAIADTIMKRMKLTSESSFESIHNYIDLKTKVLRKGAVSSQEGEAVIIPINMRDGAIIGIGKGNSDWNYSAPHGAGRLFSRGEAKDLLSVEDYKKEMTGIWTSCVCGKTIDESPMVYKPMQEIIDCIYDTVDIKTIIKPVYNFKAN